LTEEAACPSRLRVTSLQLLFFVDGNQLGRVALLLEHLLRVFFGTPQLQGNLLPCVVGKIDVCGRMLALEFLHEVFMTFVRDAGCSRPSLDADFNPS
jgi:hypothetical protein